MPTISIEVRHPDLRLKEVEQFLGTTRLYRKGTNPEVYADFPDRSAADLAVVNLN